MEIDKFNFVLELAKKQLESVKSSTDKDANQVALGLFGNESFVEVLEQVGGKDFRFHTKHGWATDDKPALIFDIVRIIGIIENTIDENSN